MTSFGDEEEVGEEFVGSSPLVLGTSTAAGVAAGYVWGRHAEPGRRFGIAAGVGMTAFALSITFAKGSVLSHMLNGAAAMTSCFAAGAFLREKPALASGLAHRVGGTSFEEAWSHAGQTYYSGPHVPDLTADQLGRPFAGGAFLDACGVPADMGVTIKAAVQNGRAVGVTVTTSPPNPRIAACVDSAVRRMSFPPNPNLDAVTQTF